MRRVVFRVDLPAKSLAVKAAPEKVIKDVLKPVLLRYGIKPSNMFVYLVCTVYCKHCEVARTNLVARLCMIISLLRGIIS